MKEYTVGHSALKSFGGADPLHNFRIRAETPEKAYELHKLDVEERYEEENWSFEFELYNFKEAAIRGNSRRSDGLVLQARDVE